MTEELKPCPFCGGHAKITVEDVEPQADRWYGSNEQRFVKCKDCGCALFDKYFHEGFGSDANAAEVWNTRAESGEVARLKARIAELESIIDELDFAQCTHPDGLGIGVDFKGKPYCRLRDES